MRANPPHILVIASPEACPRVREQVQALYDKAQITCIDVTEIERDLEPRTSTEDFPREYAAVVVSIPGLDDKWRQVVAKLRERWSNHMLPIVMVGPERLECEAMTRRGANGYITPKDEVDPVQQAYLRNVFTVLTAS